ncbi:hypothetical protein EELLY_v1c06480 [Entomoplasma ellychniae]|uniref:Uncharacterized protein n=1 Tax=Entomoplasma ellychniae TaxID=2114 RepID=A0A8E2QWG9_9MOLU|nr:hypothetical protein [Entomoplasma ellychniae]PPE04962.1 hypothetical protein EELLY_v1c06480 [Entomoplasma ellychniae]
MKEWALKNLASLASVIGAVVWALIVILISFVIGYGVKSTNGVLVMNDLQDTSSYGLATWALILSIIGIVPVAIRLLLGILTIDFFARLFNLATIILNVISIVLLIVLSFGLLGTSGMSVSVLSIVGFYILILIGSSMFIAPIIKK